MRVNRRVLFMSALSLLFACGEPVPSESDMSLPEDMMLDSTMIDMLADIPELPERTIPHQNKPTFSACSMDFECERGAICLERACRVFASCAASLPDLGFFPDRGCQILDSGTSVRNGQECETDQDCQAYLYGDHCIVGVCYPEPSCAAENPCPGNKPMCSYGLVCTER